MTELELGEDINKNNDELDRISGELFNHMRGVITNVLSKIDVEHKDRAILDLFEIFDRNMTNMGGGVMDKLLEEFRPNWRDELGNITNERVH